MHFKHIVIDLFLNELTLAMKNGLSTIILVKNDHAFSLLELQKGYVFPAAS